MACQPDKQLFDSCRPEYTNIGVVHAPEGMVTEITVDNIPEGVEIPVLYKDNTGAYVPYIVDGAQIVITSDNSSVIVEDGYFYQIDTSAVPEDADPCVVASSETRPKPIEVTLDIGEDCDNPLYVNVCNSDAPITGIEIGFAPLGCVRDETTGELVGKVFTAETQSEDGSPSTYRLVFVSVNGTVTDPYVGTWEECAADDTDVEIQRLCLIDDNTGAVLQYVTQEILYDSAGERIGERFVDAVTGQPVAMPGGTHIGICEEPEDCPTPFATECYELPYKRQAYDNGFGTGPCPSAPTSGPDEGGGGPSFACQGTYQITSWIIDGVEQITTPLSFTGQVCGPDVDGQLGLHEQWANVLASVDSGEAWGAFQSVECANYVALSVTPENQERQYGPMILNEVNAPNRIWVIDGAADEDTLRYTRVFQKDCDGNIISIWLDHEGVEIEEPEGELRPCGSGQDNDDNCVSCQTLIMCDTVNDPDQAVATPWNVVSVEPDATDPDHILHYSLSPADDPTKVGVVTFQSSSDINGTCANPDMDYAISNPSRRTVTLDAVAQEMNAFQMNMIDFDDFEPTYIPSGYVIPDRLGGTAEWTDTPGNNVNILPTENNGTGLLIWDNPPEQIAIQVGNTGGGLSCSEVSFEALTLGTMNRSFLRTICRDCDGEIVAVSDTDMDGVTPYETQGLVTVCSSEASETPPEPVPSTPVQTGVIRTTGTAPIDTSTQFPTLRSITITVISGEVSVNASAGSATTLPQGMSMTWSIQREDDQYLSGFIISGVDETSDYILNWTYK